MEQAGRASCNTIATHMQIRRQCDDIDARRTLDRRRFRPNKFGAMQITYVPMARGFIYLAAVLESWFKNSEVSDAPRFHSRARRPVLRRRRGRAVPASIGRDLRRPTPRTLHVFKTARRRRVPWTIQLRPLSTRVRPEPDGPRRRGSFLRRSRFAPRATWRSGLRSARRLPEGSCRAAGRDRAFRQEHRADRSV